MEDINQDNFSEPVEPSKQTVHPDALRPEKVTAYYPLLLAIMLAVGVYLGTMIGGAPAGSKH